MIFQIFQQSFAKIISAVATLIISLGIVTVIPAADYAVPFHKTLQNTVGNITDATASQKSVVPEEKKKNIAVSPENNPPAAGNSGQKKSEPTSSVTPQTPAILSAELNTKVRKTIVNIICGNQGSALSGITGSGVIISPKGIILTNAHIGQYFLLENSSASGYMNCQIRTGDIAEPAYDAKLIYIPSIWIENNLDNILLQEAEGTGKNDYAFLLIDRSNVQGKELPQTFDFTEPDFDFSMLPFNFSTLISSYPAALLSSDAVQKNLGLTSTFAPITDFFTFSEKGPIFLDIFALGGNIAAQGGSSGGAVVNPINGKLIGMITTSSEATTTAKRTLYAITLPYIKRCFETLTDKNLIWFLEDPASYDTLPAAEFDRLKELLIKRLEQK